MDKRSRKDWTANPSATEPRKEWAERVETFNDIVDETYDLLQTRTML